MRALLPIVLLLLQLRPATAQQCHADFDGSGAVEINELISAVGEALRGCGPTTPTPAPVSGCPIRFTANNKADDLPVCTFDLGASATDCYTTAFYTDGSFLVLAIEANTGTIYYGATVTDATHARVIARWMQPDLSDFRYTSGEIRLPATDGRRLFVDIEIASCGTISPVFYQTEFPARPAIRAMLNKLRLL